MERIGQTKGNTHKDLKSHENKLDHHKTKEYPNKSAVNRNRIVIYLITGKALVTASFFQKAWPVTVRDFVVAVQTFFRTGMLLKAVNATIIVIVPKKKSPSMGEFCPISCCIVMLCINASLRYLLIGCCQF